MIKYIKLSSVRNQVFQSKVKALLGKEIELHLNVKTRRNTILIMLEPLIKTETAIREILLEFRADLSLANNVDFDALKGIEGNETY